MAVSRTAVWLPDSSSGAGGFNLDNPNFKRSNREFSKAFSPALLDDGMILNYARKRVGQLGLNQRVYYLNSLNNDDFNSAFTDFDVLIENINCD